MSVPIPSVDVLRGQVRAVWRNRFPGRSLGDTSFLGKLSEAEMMTFYMFLQAVVLADNNAKPSSKSSLAALVEWAETIGLPNGNGGYGQKQSTVAAGLTGLVTGTKGTIYTGGLTLLGSDGATEYELVSGVTIDGGPPGTGSISGIFNATTPGTVGNAKANDVLTWSSQPTGSDANVVLTSGPSTLGIDVESASDLLQRILDRYRSPPKGGTASDFRGWAESVSGVKRAYVYPVLDGIGTVRTVVTSAGSGQNRKLANITNVSNYIETVRPVTAQGQPVKLPVMPDYGTGVGNTGGLTIRLRMIPSIAKYAFDWDDTAGALTIDTYTAPTGGNPATIELTAPAPASLISAITNQTAARLQILVSTTGGPAVPIQVKCTAIDGGHTILTLEDPLPKGFDDGAWVAPTNGDIIYAGGPMATVIAAAVLDYVDSLGPSRDSGYAASGDFWEASVAIARLNQIALDQRDTDGTVFASNIKPTGVTIKNGTNAADSIDVAASDNSPDGAELLWAKWIAVTQ